MENPRTEVETLKEILKHIRDPEALDRHPWTESLVVQAAFAQDGRDLSPGQRLVAAIGELFTQMRPATPPKRGVRLDTRWGRFGLLAAQYFAPYAFGTRQPETLYDAWGYIDPAILWYVYGRPARELSPAEVERYRFVSDERGVAPYSTISDWHRKGIERLAAAFYAREKQLSRSLVSSPKRVRQPVPAWVRMVRTVLLSAVLLLLVLGGLKGWRLYQSTRRVMGDVSALRAAVPSLAHLDQAGNLGGQIASTRQDLADLRKEAAPVLWVTSSLGWVPTYGGDLASAGALLDMAERLTAAADEAYQASGPLLDYYQSHQAALSFRGLSDLLAQQQPHFVAAREALREYQVARNSIDASRLSPGLQGMLAQVTATRGSWTTGSRPPSCCPGSWERALTGRAPMCCCSRTKTSCARPAGSSPRWAIWCSPTASLSLTASRIPRRWTT